MGDFALCSISIRKIIQDIYNLNQIFNKITNALGESDITQMIEIINRMSKTLPQMKDQ